MMSLLTENQWAEYKEQGFLRLGPTVAQEELMALQRRIDEIMLGTAPLDYDRMMLQLDTETGEYSDMLPQTPGHKGPSLNYRKIEGLELDPLFLSHMQRPLFGEICSRVYGPDKSISVFRAMFMNKPAGGGTILPWHQDIWFNLDRLALVTVWTALDDSTVANGCMRILPGSHKLGPAEEHSAFMSDERNRELEARFEPTFLEFEAGESVILHNLLLHTSGVNETDQPRRAFSAGYLDGATRRSDGSGLPVVFGEGALTTETV
jgi:phytanoyl-CoA hydroxylase